MATYLLKTEPDDYSYEDLVREKKTIWDGVSNPGACVNLRRMVKGDEALIYHTGKVKAIVGVAKVVRGAYPDPKRPEETSAGDIKYPVVDITPSKAAKTPVTLKDIKADDRFADFALVRQGRLSVMEVPRKLDTILRRLTGL